MDPPPIAVADWVVWLGDVFMMASLFFIAGYFAVPSLDRWGTGEFLKRKVARLLVPCLLVTLFLNPLTIYPFHCTNDFALGVPRMSYWQYWALFLRDGLHLHVGSTIEDGQLRFEFGQFHCWFLSVLMLFFVFYAAAHAAGRRWGRPLHARGPASRRTIAMWLLWSTVAGAVIVGLLAWVEPVDKWLTIGPFLPFEVPDVGLYVVYFVMGIAACRGRWFEQRRPLGPGIYWGAVCVVLSTVYLMFMIATANDPSLIDSRSIAFVRWGLRVPLCLALLCSFLTFAQRWANKPNPVNRTLAAHSYGTYLVHMVVMIYLQWALLLWDGGPSWVKFLVSCVLSILLSYAAAILVARVWSAVCAAWARVLPSEPASSYPDAA